MTAKWKISNQTREFAENMMYDGPSDNTYISCVTPAHVLYGVYSLSKHFRIHSSDEYLWETKTKKIPEINCKLQDFPGEPGLSLDFSLDTLSPTRCHSKALCPGIGHFLAQNISQSKLLFFENLFYLDRCLSHEKRSGHSPLNSQRKTVTSGEG